MGCCGSIDNIDDNELIRLYITEDCNYRKSNGSNINLDKQLKMERIEIICMGCFLYRNRELINNHTIEIIIRDKSINNMKYRPDLIYRYRNKIYHIEIDENSHSGYDKSKEEERYKQIKDYCISTYNSYNLIRFNPNVYGKLEKINDKLHIAEQFTNLLCNIDGLLLFEHE